MPEPSQPLGQIPDHTGTSLAQPLLGPVLPVLEGLGLIAPPTVPPHE